MNSRRTLISLFVTMSVHGATIGYFASFNTNSPKPVELSFTVLSVVLIYLWYYFDAAERNYKRTALLGGAIIMFSLVAIPYYLARSRPSGAKAKALLRFLGLLVLSVLVVALAALPLSLAHHGG